MRLRFALWAVLLVIALVVIVVVVGWMLPKDHVASVSARLPAPPARVFAAIVDVEHYPEWRKDVSQVDLLSRTPRRWKEHGSNGVITYELREERPPNRLVSVIADPTLPFGGSWTYELAPEGDGTRLTITERGEVKNPIFRFVSRVFMSPTATMDHFVAGLRAQIVH